MAKTREYYLEYRKKNPDKKREIERRSRNRPEAKARRKAYAAEYAKKHPDKVKEWRNKFRDKNRARKKFKLAVKAGKIKRLPCEVCGDTKVDGHHTDYTKPFEVRWLCRKHHMDEHRKFG